MNTPKLTKRQRRLLGQKEPEDTAVFKSHFKMMPLVPLTKGQDKTIKAYDSGKQIVLSGSAGTGKTFLALALALRDILAGDTEQKRIIIIRSTVSTREIGYLPGNETDKAAVFEAPYIAICTELFGRADAYQILKTKGVIQFMSTSFVRGITLNNAIVIIDEGQNLTSHEANSVITRLGKDTRVIVSGDIKQSDLGQGKSRERSGFSDLLKIFAEMDEFDIINFSKEDIVRSGLVKSYIITRDELEEDGIISPLY